MDLRKYMHNEFKQGHEMAIVRNELQTYVIT